MCVSQVHTDWHVCMGYIHSNDCDQWVQVSYFIPRLSEIHIYVVTLYIFHYILYPTSIQRRDRRRKGVYFSTNKPRHEELARRIQNVWHSTKNSRKTLYLCISRRIIGLLTSDIFMKGSVPVTLPCIFDILLIKGVLTLRYDNQRINVKYIWYFFIQKQINGIFYVRYFVLFFSLHLSDYLIDDMKCIQL